MTTIKIDYKRLAYLGTVVRDNTATIDERDEYMLLLYKSNQISKEQYESYKSGIKTDDIIKVALTVGAIFLLGYILSEALNEK